MNSATRYCLIAFPVFYGLLAMMMGQDANWDLRNYHWYNAYAFMNGRLGFDLLPSQTPYFYNPLIDLPLYWVATHFSALTTSFFLGALQGLNFVLLFTLTRRVLYAQPGRDGWALTVAFFGMIGGGTLGELGTTFYDNIVSLGVLGTLSILVLRLGQAEEGKRVRWWKWLLAGIPVGLVSGLKLPTTVFAVGIGLAFFCRRAAWRDRLGRSAVVATGMVLGFALGLGPWAVYLHSEFGSPLFPYFNDIFLSPLAPAVSARDIKFLAEGWEKLYFPLLFTADPMQVGEVVWRDLKIPLVYVLLPLALLLRLRQPADGAPTYNTENTMANTRGRFVLWAGVACFVIWMQLFSIYRYAIPLEMLSALMLLLAVDAFRVNAYNKKMALLGLFVICLGAMQTADWGRVPHGEKFVTVAGADLPEPANSMVLMAGWQPYSHVVPAFAPQAAFIRIQSNFSSPEEAKEINRLIQRRVADHQGDLWLLVPTYDGPWVDEIVLPQFGLKAMLNQCRIVTNNLAEDLHLCPVKRSATKNKKKT